MSSDAVPVVVVVVLVDAAGFLAMAETGLTRMGEARATALAAEGRTGGRALARQVRHPERFLGPLLLWALLSAPAVGALASTPVLRLLTRGLIALHNAIVPGKGLRQGPFVSEAELLAVADIALIEELIGEITDEYDIEEPLVEPHGDGTTQLSGRIRIDELNELLGTDFPEGDWDTAAGFVCALLGHIPSEGETATSGDHTLRADRVRGRRVTRILLAKRAAAHAGNSSQIPLGTA